MPTTRVFNSGNSQAVRIPKEYQFEVGEVHINKIGSSVIVTPLSEVWSTVRDAVDEFPDDFTGRQSSDSRRRKKEATGKNTPEHEVPDGNLGTGVHCGLAQTLCS